MEAYLDNSATTQPCAEAIDAIQNTLTKVWGNPSSLHRVGLEAEHLLEQCRTNVANSLSCAPGEIYFTSGGTESNNLALFGAANALRRRGRRIITSSIEHSSIAESAHELQNRGFEVIYLPVDSGGSVPETELQRFVNKDTILVSLMAVNNETGALQPVDSIRRAVRYAGAPALIHCDAVQAYGKVPLSPRRIGIDLMTVSSHKIHGPKGVGALYVRSGVKLQPGLHGGSQEQKLRPGTEATPAIAGFSAAAAALPDSHQTLPYVASLRDHLMQALQSLDGVQINSPLDALPYLTNLSVPGIPSETMVNFCSARGVCVSAGSACAKGKKSRVLRAMNLSEALIASAIRVSLSRFTTFEEIDYFIYVLKQASLSISRKH